MKHAILIIFLNCFALPVFGADLEIPSSFNPVGSGARALGIGGAFIAAADDATSASWNPGGLIQLRTPEFSFVTSYSSRKEKNDFGTNPEASGVSSVSETDFNYFSAVYPFNLFDYNMVFSLSYQRLYDLNRIWDFTMTSRLSDFSFEDIWHYRQEGELSAVGLSYCVQIRPSLSAGVTLNIWNDDLSDNSWKKRYFNASTGISGQSPFTNKYARTDDYRFKGVNANIGFLWSAARNVTVGAVIKTPFRADLTHAMKKSWEVRYPDEPEYDQIGSASGQWDETLKMPMSYGIGVLFNATDRLLLAADMYRTEWDDFVLKDENGAEISPITGKHTNESHIRPAHQLHIGAEYLLIKDKPKGLVIPVRVGFFYDPAPAPEKHDNFFGFSFGAGVTKTRYFSFDVAYQYRFGNNVGAYMLPDMGFSQDVREHAVYASFIIYTSAFFGKGRTSHETK